MTGTANAKETAKNTRSSRDELALLTLEFVRWDCVPKAVIAIAA